MRESRTYGSVRGASSNGGPYRDRRQFIAGLGGAVAWPLVAPAQQPAMPVIGYLGTGSAGSTGIDLDGFRQGLADAGFVDGRNLTIKYRWAEGRDDRLPALAAEFITQQVAVIVVTSNSGALTAKAARSTIPIVFSMGGDPVRLGLVDSLNRPGSNLTGIAVLSDILIKKRLQLLKELVPNAPFIAVLLNPSHPVTETRRRDVQVAAQAIGQKISVLMASTAGEIDNAFATLAERRFDALLVGSDGFLGSRRQQIIALAIRHGVATGFESRIMAEAGGLMSYGHKRTEAGRQAGIYTGRILKGEKPADLPVIQPTKFELVINLTTAKALGLTIPETLLATADEVIQ
jgi:putative tryptophan/tyrosine transport system substrate-binding protein